MYAAVVARTEQNEQDDKRYYTVVTTAAPGDKMYERGVFCVDSSPPEYAFAQQACGWAAWMTTAFLSCGRKIIMRRN